jgi:hypothetical protein
MKRIAGIGKGTLKHSNWKYDYTNGFVVLAYDLEMFSLGALV